MGLRRPTIGSAIVVTLEQRGHQVQRFTQKRIPLARLGATFGASAASALLLLAGSVSISAHAASFDCKKAASYSEHQVCNNPHLSQLDDKLAVAWKQALSVTPDKTSLEASRDQQWKWRQTNCHDDACVENWYERRISELNADYDQGKKAQRVAFELNLDHQNLNPDAASAIRAMKAE